MIDINKEISAIEGKSKLAVILGSGLSPSGDEKSVHKLISYSDIGILPVPTAKGHPGIIFLFERLDGSCVYLFAGRSHLYEGVSREQAAAGVDLASKLGCRKVLFVNTAGSLTSRVPLESWFIPSDLMAFPFNYGGHKGINGYRRDYCPAPLISDSFRKEVITAAMEASIHTYEGTLMWNVGPCYETCTEASAVAELGADAVTMSILPELIESSDKNIETAILSRVTNYTPNVNRRSVSHDEVIRSGKKAKKMLFRILSGL
ncbi:MAG: hypothetical protein U5O15_02295 [Candidatus Krumholzibacteriota bacterium]|nr:hypothetical protein [Candidatus Krumholzibacteriota bacterium]